MRFAFTIVMLAAGATFAAACGGRSPSAEQTAAAGPPTAVTLVPVAQGLTFTGYVAGVMSEGTGECQTSPSRAIFQLTIAGQVGGVRHSIRVVAESYNGPGSYGPDAPRRATFTLDSGGGSVGVIVVGDDGTSGTIDVDLIDGEHVSGTWTCTAVAVP